MRLLPLRLLLLLQVILCGLFVRTGQGLQTPSAPPADVATVIAHARQLVAQHHPAEADALLADAVIAHPHQFILLAELGELRLQQGDLAGAEPLLIQASDLTPAGPRIQLDLGKLFLATKRFKEAMDRFETVLSADARNPAARSGELESSIALALKERNAQHPEAALEILQHARKVLPDDPTLLTDLGILADAQGHYPLAANALKESLSLRPGDPTTIYALGRVELDQQHMPSAEQHLRQYLALRPQDSSAYYGLGRVLAMEQRSDEAKAAFAQSIELQPVQSESYYEFGVIAANAGDTGEAGRLFRKVLERAPAHGGALVGLGKIAYQAKDYTAARKSLSEAVIASPEYQPAHYYLGLTLARLGEKQASEQELAKATELTTKQQSKAAPVHADPQD